MVIVLLQTVTQMTPTHARGVSRKESPRDDATLSLSVFVIVALLRGALYLFTIAPAAIRREPPFA